MSPQESCSTERASVYDEASFINEIAKYNPSMDDFVFQKVLGKAYSKLRLFFEILFCYDSIIRLLKLSPLPPPPLDLFPSFYVISLINNK